ncbi:RTA1 like protein-domain-containing protein [Mycena sp. CBHHK59/15]|nr:RTA1 like protein-domain-containing protein [Mycena sp. CBHHK59/15]KAJ6608142.1 RTA1 like protein-domain-containing protein [Mycena sp. CBHHK59/15]
MLNSNASDISPEILLANPSLNPYGYVPSKPAALAFISLFVIATVAHVGQAIFFRMWWLFPTVCLSGFLEIAGWIGRLMSNQNISSTTGFTIQIVCTIVGPTPLISVNFVLLAQIVRRLGQSYSWITAKWYSIIFVSCDIIALVVQGLGGGQAAHAATTGHDPKLGANVMLAGIAFQFATLTLYIISAAEFFRRYIKKRAARKSSPPLDTRGYLDTRLNILIGELTFSTTCLFIRSIYRIIELATGWGGRIITTEIYFAVLDGVMVLLAIFSLNIAHPGWSMRAVRSEVEGLEQVKTDEFSLKSIRA